MLTAYPLLYINTAEPLGKRQPQGGIDASFPAKCHPLDVQTTSAVAGIQQTLALSRGGDALDPASKFSPRSLGVMLWQLLPLPDDQESSSNKELQGKSKCVLSSSGSVCAGLLEVDGRNCPAQAPHPSPV